jgi:hypothetical protein
VYKIVTYVLAGVVLVLCQLMCTKRRKRKRWKQQQAQKEQAQKETARQLRVLEQLQKEQDQERAESVLERETNLQSQNLQLRARVQSMSDERRASSAGRTRHGECDPWHEERRQLEQRQEDQWERQMGKFSPPERHTVDERHEGPEWVEHRAIDAHRNKQPVGVMDLTAALDKASQGERTDKKEDDRTVKKEGKYLCENAAFDKASQSAALAAPVLAAGLSDHLAAASQLSRQSLAPFSSPLMNDIGTLSATENAHSEKAHSVRTGERVSKAAHKMVRLEQEVALLRKALLIRTEPKLGGGGGKEELKMVARRMAVAEKVDRQQINKLVMKTLSKAVGEKLAPVMDEPDEQARHEQARHEQARHEQARHEQARHEQARHEQARHEQARREKRRAHEKEMDRARKEAVSAKEEAAMAKRELQSLKNEIAGASIAQMQADTAEPPDALM